MLKSCEFSSQQEAAVIELTQWMESFAVHQKPWLILGKGPTFSEFKNVDASEYNTLSLNHVVRQTKVDVAHMIDADVAEDCADELYNNCQYLVMPWHPHVKNDPTSKTLADFVAEIPVLKKLDEENRLVWYNLSSAKPKDNSPTIQAKFFSAEAALNILGQAGVKKVRSLGVDGGRGYSGAFADLETKTMLANGHGSFDNQTAEINAISKKWGIDYAPLSEPMRVFVGTDESQMVATRVLEYSIRKFATRPVTVHPMLNLPIPKPKHHKNRGRTGFSFARFVIPELCGYRGRGLYTDADMQVFSDLAELWDIPFNEQRILCTNQPETPKAWQKPGQHFHPGRQMSVMLLDCERLDWKIDEIIKGMDDEKYTYQDLLFEMCIVPENEIADRIPPEWNCLEWWEKDVSKLTHYTVVPTQPWKNDENPNRHIWEEDYRAAVAAGAVDAKEVLAGIRAGHLKESLKDAFSQEAWQAAEAAMPEPVEEPKAQVAPPAPVGLGRMKQLVGKAIRNPGKAINRILGRRAA